jgi:hypothetical protein
MLARKVIQPCLHNLLPPIYGENLKNFKIQFPRRLKIYYNAKRVKITINDENNLGDQQCFTYFVNSNERGPPM